MKNKIKVVPLLIAVIMCAVFLSACGIVTNDNSAHAFDDAAISDVNIKFDDCDDAPTVDSIVSNDKIDNTYLDSDNSKPNKTPTLPDIVFPSAPETSPSGSNDGKVSNSDSIIKTDSDRDINSDEVVTLIYLASDGGRIDGESTQTVMRGVYTKEVRAVAEDGFVFIKWSDGSIAKQRSDIADKSFTVTAEFAQETVVIGKLKFTIEEYEDGYKVAANDRTLTEAIIPDYVNGLPVISVAERGFSTCTELNYVFIPDTVKEIYPRAFTHCKNLRTVKGMLGVIALDANAFEDCINLEKIIGMNKLRFLSFAFNGCKSLKKYILPETVEYIFLGNSQLISSDFYSRRILTRVKLTNTDINYNIPTDTVSIPHITYIGAEGKPNDEYALKDDDELFNFTLTNDGAGYSVSARDYDMTEALIPSHYNGLPVTEIADRGFMNSKVVTAYVPETVIKIGQNAFSGCGNLIRVAGLNEVTAIGAEAFSDCIRLNEIVLPHSLEKAGANIFKNNPNTIYIRKSRAEADKINAQWDNARPASAKTVCVGEMGMPSDVGGGMHFFYNKIIVDGKAITGYSLSYVEKNISEAVIPATINGVPIIGIHVRVCQDHEKLKKVYIPDTVVDIMLHAFRNCKNLERVYGMKNVKTLYIEAFEGCDKLQRLVFPNDVIILRRP